MTIQRPVLTFTFRAPRARVRLAGDFDLAARDHLHDVMTCLRSRGCVTVEVDAQDVTFVDAAYLRTLSAEAALLREAGGALQLVAASATFARTAEAAGYRNLMPEGSARAPRGRPQPSDVPGPPPARPAKGTR